MRLKSFPLVPINDKSLLIIGSGMAPLKPYFTGQETPPSKRVTTCQKCVRVNDIENVGKTSRHGTFFEMLGNFSFGDYFKAEIIPWSWEFLTEVMGIPQERLYVTVYTDDDEAYDIWRHKVGLPPEKIFRLGEETNFWEVGLGPCGPCSEIYFDKGEKYGCGQPGCNVGCECDRYIEVWNLVFTQFCKEEDGSYSKLKSSNIDTGMGLERIASVMQDVDTLFDVDTMLAIRNHVCEIAGVKYNEDLNKDISIRIITDHIRSVTFMTADGILPSNEGRGYVLRRLLRRAARHGKLLGINSIFLQKLCQTVIDVSKDAYPELLEKREYIFKVLSVEENRFYETLDTGITLLKGFVSKLRAEGKQMLIGQMAFKLYDTFGFPIELMREMLEDEGMTVDEEAFTSEMDKQRERARSAREESTYMGADETIFSKLDASIKTEFVGYSKNTADAKITALVVNKKSEKETAGVAVESVIAESAAEGDEVSVVLDVTPFYAESGGQKGDRGVIKTSGGVIEISDCVKVPGGRFAHNGVVKSGTVKVNEAAHAEVDIENRLATARNHSATHLLQRALRDILGSHVEQSGSSVSHDRLRFDFTHFSALTPAEIRTIEDIVNDKILEGLPISVAETSMDEARKLGAMALFGEKYGEVVRVVSMGDYSVELCGGTHLASTNQIGLFKIVSEGSVASGVRRIEALTGKNARNYYKELDERTMEICTMMKTTPAALGERIRTFLANAKDLGSQLEKLKSQAALNIVDEIVNERETVNGVSVIVKQLDGLDMNGLRTMCDKIKDKLRSGVIILGAAYEGKVNFAVMATDDAVKAGVNAGAIVKEAAQAVGGSGGGRPNMAQAGGKDVSKIKEALKKGREVLVGQVTK